MDSRISAATLTRAMLNCPAWCTARHDVEAELGENLVEHTCEVWAGTTPTGRELSVDVSQVDTPSTVKREPARVYVAVDEPVAADVALQMAAALMNAVDIARVNR